MSSGAGFGRSATMVDVMTPPENPWLKKISAAKVVLPKGVRILRNSSEESNAKDRHAALRVAKVKLRDFVDMA
jgi:hypothetical protein